MPGLALDWGAGFPDTDFCELFPEDDDSGPRKPPFIHEVEARNTKKIHKNRHPENRKTNIGGLAHFSLVR
jgi:hypothetical protein